jgi:hypothetical protein
MMAVTDTTESKKPAGALAQTAELAGRLVEASRRKSFDPFRDIDWSVPVDDRAYHLPPEYLPLHGTGTWERMTEAERVAYSRHETAALCGTGIWLENILMRVLIDKLYELRPGHPLMQYLLVETGDECRHSSMFSEYIRRAKTPEYRPSRKLRVLGRLVRSVYGEASAFVAVLAAEELLDQANRATAADKRLHPVSRAIARIHVTEEARHVSLAKKFLSEVYPTLGWLERLAVAVVAPFTVHVIASSMLNREVYDAIGFEHGYDEARNNPLHRERILKDLRPLTAFLTRIGVIRPLTRPLWQKLGLLAGESPVNTDAMPEPAHG